MLTLDTIGLFSFDFSGVFHIETPVGNFEWHDPEYNGDNTIKPTVRYKEWIKKRGIPFARHKGKHKIIDYCGPDVKIIQ